MADSIRHNPELERAVLGSALADNDAVETIQAVMGAADLYTPAHATAWEAIVALRAKKMRIDRVSLAQELRDRGRLSWVEGTVRLDELEFFGANAANVETYAQQVADLADARRIEGAALEIVRAARDGETTVDELRDQFTAAMTAAAPRRQAQRETTMHDAAVAFYARMEAIAARGPGIQGAATGLKGLDDLLGGYGPKQLVIVAARPAMGKTSLAMGQVRAIAEKHGPVCVFSLEMGTDELFARLACAAADVDYMLVKHGRVTQATLSALAPEVQKLAALPIFVFDAGETTIHDIKAQARRIRNAYGLAAVFVDYLQIVNVPKADRQDSRDRDVAELSRALKSLAKELEVPVVALSQLSRSCESRQDKRPMLSDLRDSGAVEQDADVVVFVYRHAVYDKTAPPEDAELIVAKQRSGPCDTVRARWIGRKTRFENVEG